MDALPLEKDGGWDFYVQDFPVSWMKLWTGIYQLFWVCSSDLQGTTLLSLLTLEVN